MGRCFFLFYQSLNWYEGNGSQKKKQKKNNQWCAEWFGKIFSHSLTAIMEQIKFPQNNSTIQNAEATNEWF